VKSGILKLRLFLEKFKNQSKLKDLDIVKAMNILKIIIRFLFKIDESQTVDYFEIQLEPFQEN